MARKTGVSLEKGGYHERWRCFQFATLGEIELRESLGRGGMAEVWKAYDSQLKRFVAIKILHADLQSDPEF